MNRNRRNFLKSCCNVTAATAGLHLARLGGISAFAQSTSNYKALVCVFLFGGNDSNNMIVPIDTTRYTLYQRMRGPVAIPQTSLLAAGTTGYGVHPSMTNMQRLIAAKQGAIMLNVGTLFRPTTKANMNTVPLPKNLYSHSDQTQQWQSSDPNGGTSGWGGRLNDRVGNLNTGPLPPGISLNGGSALFLNAVTAGVNFSNLGSYGLNTFGDGNAMNARVAGLTNLLKMDTGLQLVNAANGVLNTSIATAQEINTALNSAPVLPVTFPNTGLGNQLAQAARIMSVRAGLGMSRQIFFAGMGGFDNHENLLAKHAQLMAEIDGAIGAFATCMDRMTLSRDVTLFTESEFNRTGNANSNVGTDHAWGSHHFVVGGAVNGDQAYGALPVHQLNGPDDAGNRGLWIPSTSLDQYAATLGSWFGVSDADLQLALPNLQYFTPRKLAFL